MHIGRFGRHYPRLGIDLTIDIGDCDVSYAFDDLVTFDTLDFGSATLAEAPARLVSTTIARLEGLMRS